MMQYASSPDSEQCTGWGGGGGRLSTAPKFPEIPYFCFIFLKLINFLLIFLKIHYFLFSYEYDGTRGQNAMPFMTFTM
jgi:hypothetical protein